VCDEKHIIGDTFSFLSGIASLITVLEIMLTRKLMKNKTDERVKSDKIQALVKAV